ncbi:hypothetical protein AB0945_17165 [Streptomyces sp. NPDC005474]|uniref:hypothetical protein n=1 Tax=Streptomyces sp. NPDC005474 TaxID=3154878 RepID=UPI00345573B8
MNRDSRSTPPTRRPSSPAAPFADHPLATALARTDELAEALLRHGITLPSLTPDLASCTATTAPRQLIELGRVNMDTARRLVDVLRNADVDPGAHTDADAEEK